MNKVRRNPVAIILFLLPGLIIYLTLVINPIIQSFVLSTFKWVTLSKKVFVGFENYETVFRDRFFWSSIKNSFLYMAGSVTLQVIFGFTLGYFIYMQLKGYRFFKTIFFMPNVLAMVAVGFIWGYIYSPSIGLLKPFLSAIGLGHLYTPPLATPGIALFFVVFANVWQSLGISIMLFNSGFMNMPPDVIEMASIDGASGFRMLFYMIIPLAWEITKTVIILQVIGALRAFDLVYIMTGGGPNHATEVLPMHMFVHAFENFNIGLGNVIAVTIFVLCFGMTMLLRKVLHREAIEF